MKNIKEELEELLYDYGVAWTDALADRLINEFHLEDKEIGHWIDTDPDDACFYMCSKCHGRADIKFDYCPNCGAKMEKQHEI